ncbi:MAG: peptide-methionine (S)-S-oxide reductase MsrA [Sterolibacterium sp.]|jgi:peptide-methionine (S)-S-oxide reductase|nr:peptide-methionine (S)-S-oxide reductase MsrA [Sterolibacterium sp.]MBP9799941.1 peptide-methionine (S)-S-oxide reductase MsrA [Sterolibacterium sp.]
MKNDAESHELATLGGGCFWCLEAIFQRLHGVISVTSGYCGGHEAQPTYESVCAGDSGHAEVVQIRFDPQEISYETLLEVFFALHDPTTRNRQGHDIGSQYRSILFTHSAEQERIAHATMAARAADFPAPLVTEIEAIATAPFYPAEQYHQNYYTRHPHQGYCQAVIAPKLTKLLNRFGEHCQSSTVFSPS